MVEMLGKLFHFSGGTFNRPAEGKMYTVEPL